MWSRTNPLLRKGAEIVASGELGPVRHAAASFGFAFDGDPSHRLLDPEQAGGAILDLGVYPVHLVNLFLGEPNRLIGTGSRGETGVDVHAAATLAYDATDRRPAATASVVCSLVDRSPDPPRDLLRGRLVALRQHDPAGRVRAEARVERRSRSASSPSGRAAATPSRSRRSCAACAAERSRPRWCPGPTPSPWRAPWTTGRQLFLPERPWAIRWPPSAGVAQLAAHLSCKQVVGGSSPPASSMHHSWSAAVSFVRLTGNQWRKGSARGDAPTSASSHSHRPDCCCQRLQSRSWRARPAVSPRAGVAPRVSRPRNCATAQVR